MEQYVDQLLPLIIATLATRAPLLREAALRTLAALVEAQVLLSVSPLLCSFSSNACRWCAGHVMDPYHKYPICCAAAGRTQGEPGHPPRCYARHRRAGCIGPASRR